MSVALPWVDTGVTKSVTHTATAAVQMSADNYIYLNDWLLFTTPLGTNPPYPPGTANPPAWREQVWLSGMITPGPSPVLLQTDTSGPPAPVQLSAAYAFTETFGPYRLGMRLKVADLADLEVPLFPRRYQIEYAWFGDRDTTRTSTFAGQTQVQMWFGSGGAWNGTGGVDFTPVQTSLPPLSFAGRGGHTISGTPLCVITGLTLDGESVDTSELDDGWWLGSGGGTVTATAPANETFPIGYAIGVPYRFAYALATTKWGVSELNAHLLDQYLTRVELHADGTQLSPFAEYIETPFVDDWVVFNLPWASHTKEFDGDVRFTIDAGWAAAQDPAMASDDLYVPVTMPTPSGAAAYTPAEISIATEVDVNRPDGAFPAPSAWTSSDAALITVTEAAGSSTFAVAGTGATVFRAFYHQWRERVGLGPLGKSDPLFGVPNYERLKHYAGEDIWPWVTYGYLKLEFTAPSAGSLTLTVAGASIDIYDPHTTSGREDAYTVDEVTDTVTYTVPVVSGANAVWVDLLFPNQGGPFYPDRIDSMTFSGFAVGNYVFTKIALAWRGTASARIKHGWGKQILRNDYSALHLSLDGAFPMGGFTDQLYKADELGDSGGAVRMYSILTGFPSGVIQDAQLTLENFWAQLNQFEGISVTWNAAESDGALEDAYGVKLGPELAMFADFVTDRSQTPGITWEPVCSVRAGSASLINGHAFTVTVNYPLWGALEALVVDSGGRAGAAVGIDAARTDTDAIVATGNSTDAVGFVIVQPVSGNGVVSFRLQEA